MDFVIKIFAFDFYNFNVDIYVDFKMNNHKPKNVNVEKIFFVFILGNIDLNDIDFQLNCIMSNIVGFVVNIIKDVFYLLYHRTVQDFYVKVVENPIKERLILFVLVIRVTFVVGFRGFGRYFKDIKIELVRENLKNIGI